MNKREKEVLQSQLNIEKQTIKHLKQVYAQAMKDCEKKIRELSMRSDMENLQSIVYQKQYQQAIKGQLEGVLEQLHSNEFATVSEYLNRCYTDGFVGSMYDLAGQGIPLIVPINQNQVAKAIQIDSKLSKTLYESLGEDVKKLKTAVRTQVSRGIANGSSWNDIAKTLADRNMKNTPFQKAINRTITIARTEGHRVQTAAKMDSMTEAKKKGADVVKQWDSTLDDKTRESHRKLDGQIRELDEPFEVDGMKADAPGHFGDPAEDCNCRCAVLQRAKWALDEEELETLKQRAEYFELDKADGFENFKNKYLKASEAENSLIYTEGEKITKSSQFAVETKMIDSRNYIDKFNNMTDEPNLKREYYSVAKEMLKHRSGQNGEDLYLYNSKTKKWFKSTSGTEAGTPEYTDEILNAIKESEKGSLISFHNHPASMPPSASDINCALQNGYVKGYALCHNGTIYEYTASDRYIDDTIYNLRIADYQEKGYNEFEAQIKTMEYLSELYNFTFREV